MERKHTPKGQSYWAQNGAYSKEMSELWKKLVPAEGEAETMHGELIRCINRLTYSHLGKKIKFADLPEDCQKLVMKDYLYLWDFTDEDGNEI